jgi:hypothetical protein
MVLLFNHFRTGEMENSGCVTVPGFASAFSDGMGKTTQQ